MASRKSKKKKIRAEFRKKHDQRARKRDMTRDFKQHGFADDDSARGERVSGKGDLTRRRTIIGAEGDESQETGFAVHLDVDESASLAGRVISVHGLTSLVRGADGRDYRCATRGLLKSLSTDQRHVVAAGDRVYFRREGEGEGLIERIEPRHGVLRRTSKGRQHVIVTNVDQLLIIASAAEPAIKPHLIDRFLIAAEQSKIRPVIVINKIDLIEPADLQPLVGVYGQMGYEVVLASAETGFGIERLRQIVAGKESVVAGQSGVGKSSLLNGIQPGLALPVQKVSEETEKGKHTTTTARLIPMEAGGFLVDTPGIRQFQLWDVIPEEVGGYFRDLRPYINRCRYPDCTHTHEEDCAVKDAVADGRLDVRRYESYCHMFGGDAL
jgi:ribosome biogenesis GTPase